MNQKGAFGCVFLSGALVPLKAAKNGRPQKRQTNSLIEATWNNLVADLMVTYPFFRSCVSGW